MAQVLLRVWIAGARAVTSARSAVAAANERSAHGAAGRDTCHASVVRVVESSRSWPVPSAVEMVFWNVLNVMAMEEKDEPAADNRL